MERLIYASGALRTFDKEVNKLQDSIQHSMDDQVLLYNKLRIVIERTNFINGIILKEGDRLLTSYEMDYLNVEQKTNEGGL